MTGISAVPHREAVRPEGAGPDAKIGLNRSHRQSGESRRV